METVLRRIHAAHIFFERNLFKRIDDQMQSLPIIDPTHIAETNGTIGIFFNRCFSIGSIPWGIHAIFEGSQPFRMS